MLNQDEFAALFDACHPRVYAYAVSRCGRRLAEEVVSETFVVAWRRRDDIPARNELPWLLGVARNVIRDVHREELRRAALDEALHAWADDFGPDVAEGVDRTVIEPLRRPAPVGQARRHLVNDLLARVGERGR